MKYDKRIWKTAALAITVTILFAVFVFNVEYLIPGANSANATAQVTKVIPHIPVGSFDGGLTKYLTAIQIVNTGSSPVTVSGTFYNPDGSASTLEMISDLIPAGFTGSLSATNLRAGAVMTITPARATAGTVNWGNIVTTGAASVSAYFELRDVATNALYNRTGIEGSSATLSHFVIPRIRNVASGLDVGFALVNTGSTAASIKLAVKDNAGESLAARTFTLSARNQITGFPFQLLASGAGCSPCLNAERSGTSYGYLTFESTSATFAAAGLAVEGGMLSGLQVEALQ
jgi:hypothetical protein